MGFVAEFTPKSEYHKMATSKIQEARITKLNEKGTAKGDYVLYWMQQSQRAKCNHALEFAIQQANELNLPLLVGFGLMDDYPDANIRHYRFMLEGLKDTQSALRQRGIPMVVQHGSPENVAISLGGKAAVIVCDRGYLSHQKLWRQRVAEKNDSMVFQVESDVVIPVKETSDKAEYAARTIRPKIHKKLDNYLVELNTTPLEKDSLGIRFESMPLENIDELLQKLRLNREVPPVNHFFEGGTLKGTYLLKSFVEESLKHYVENRNKPAKNDISKMSPYLHFGQLSALDIAISVGEKKTFHPEATDSYLEELIVRRELACNFTEYNTNYDSYDVLPDWCKKTLEKHSSDKRSHRYSRQELESARTHDRYWNAAMLEMKFTGYMHNAMRMYWGKKILEWSPTPRDAFETTIRINNKYFLDGRDPNSYTGVAWIFGVHDRPWKERDIFGTVRYMAASGLERKSNIGDYCDKVDALVVEAQKNGVKFPSSK